jgi:hypothetical protein
MAAVCVPVAPAGAQAKEPRLTVKVFCQTQDGFGVYFAMVAEGLPANSSAITTVTTPTWSTSSPPQETDSKGNLETSYGIGLSGLDDPLLSGNATLSITAGGVTVSQTVPLACDPASNAPAARAECFVSVFWAFFEFLGFNFKNAGQCVAYIGRMSSTTG